MDTQGFITVQHKKPRKPRPQPARRKKPTGWTYDADEDAVVEWANQVTAFQPQADAAAWADDPPTALTSRNLEKNQPQCEFYVDNLHYWIPFWRDCVSLALDGQDFPNTLDFYQNLYDEIGRMGWQLNGGYGPVVDSGWGLGYNKWGNASDAGWKGGNGFGWGKSWVHPVTGEPWTPPSGAENPQEDAHFGESGGDGEHHGGVQAEQEEYKPAPRRHRRRRPPRGKRPLQGAADMATRPVSGWT
ncbi:hypothetical protein PsYK624_037080 [Phanerochaete sordida]|uniref:Uncharacterized protein n=1 Tax=Phanerochaete sordida TaxID=48140 RepID=A0A9P3L9Z1_9APHY|nr:hypothetical protein PsYK624_037080 [Phanerochaete sordida]